MGAGVVVKVWWCEKHDCKGGEPEDNQYEGKHYCFMYAHLTHSRGMFLVDCKMVERRLVPVESLVIVRDADGDWPEWAKLALNHGYGVHELDECAEIALWNLAEAVK